ncbi:MAG: tetratricopeptide repeat protein [Candidatus Aminicenantales bacterium]
MIKRKIASFPVFLFLLLFFLLNNHLFPQRFLTREQTACLYLNKGEIDKAVEILQNELKIQPDNLNARLYLGIAFYMIKNLEEASKQFEKIEKEVERMTGASRPFGDEAMFTQMGMERKAELLFSKEREGLLYFCRGLTLKEKKDLKAAEKKLNKALKLKYDEKVTRLELFDLYIRMNNIKAASRQWEELKKSFEDTDLFDFLDGYLKYEKGNIDQALADFEKLSSSSSEAKKNMARIHYNRGDYQKAIEIWQEIIAQYPEDKEALVNLGRAHFHLGDRVKAQEYFNRAGLKISPERYSPKKISLIYLSLLKDVKFDLLCQVD